MIVRVLRSHVFKRVEVHFIRITNSFSLHSHLMVLSEEPLTTSRSRYCKHAIPRLCPFKVLTNSQVDVLHTWGTGKNKQKITLSEDNMEKPTISCLWTRSVFLDKSWITRKLFSVELHQYGHFLAVKIFHNIWGTWSYYQDFFRLENKLLKKFVTVCANSGQRNMTDQSVQYQPQETSHICWKI